MALVGFCLANPGLLDTKIQYISPLLPFSILTPFGQTLFKYMTSRIPGTSTKASQASRPQFPNQSSRTSAGAAPPIHLKT